MHVVGVCLLIASRRRVRVAAMSTSDGTKKKNSTPSWTRDHRIISNGERESGGSNNDGVDPTLRAKTIETMAFAKAARQKLSRAMSAGLGGTTTATATSTLSANKNDTLSLSDDDSENYDYDNVDSVDDTIVDLCNEPNDSEDEEEIPSIPPQGKGKTSLYQLEGDVVRVMKDKVKGNYSGGNPDSTSHEQLRDMLVTVVQYKAVLLAKAAVLDKTMDVANQPAGTTISSLLAAQIPDNVPKKMIKSNVSFALVDTWSILSKVLGYCTFSRKETHDLQVYIQYMSRVERYAKRVLDEDNTALKNMKSVSLNPTMMDRDYLTDGGFPTPQWARTCCSCGHIVCDQPKENKAAAKETVKNQMQWVADNTQVEKYSIGQGPPLINTKGKIITNVPTPKVAPEYFMCHCWQQMMSYVAAGVSGCYFKCLVDGIQYEIGKCPHCLCDCSFVVDKS